MSRASERKKQKARDLLDFMEPEEMAVFLGVNPTEALALLHRSHIPSIRLGERTLRVEPLDAALYRIALDDGVDPKPLYRASANGHLPAETRDRAMALLEDRPSVWPIHVMPTEGHVYLIESMEGPYRVKIGFSTNPARRLAALQAASPVALRIIETWVGTQADEARLHAALEDLRLHGEWFESEAADRARAIMEGRR